MNTSGYFKQSDPHIEELAGYQLPPDWWSRGYEYPWALTYAEAGLVVADMGCGWMYRPFKDALDVLGCKVYAVDGDKCLLTQEKRTGIEYVVADFTKPIPEIPSGSLDRIFCISVLEDVGDKISLALQEFARCLKPGGLCVLTFDVQYDMDKPLGQYPGFNFIDFWSEWLLSEFALRTTINEEKNGALFNEDFNLCVFHCVLMKKKYDGPA